MTSEISVRKKRPLLWRIVPEGGNVMGIMKAFVQHMQSSIGRDEYSSTPRERFHALALAVRDELIVRWVNTQQTYYQSDARRVYYLSLEYLMGRALHNALVNLKLLEPYREAVAELGYNLEELEEQEHDAGLGNGGLGRLAACFLDSMATLQLPAYGYGLRYDFGIFRQRITSGRQVEEPDDWLRLPNPWEIHRPEYAVRVHFNGRVQVDTDGRGRLRHHWVDTEDVLAVAFDNPVPGYGNNTVNTLRLWRAHGTEDFDLGDFNVGDYVGAVEHKVLAENISKVLYPNDNLYAGKELRLKQQYLLVAATIQDAVRRHLVNHPNLDQLARKVVFQLNDTHPALAVAELMRVLLDVHQYEWEQAWSIVTSCMAYTNHTLLPEALETWPVDLLSRLLPRHVQLINEINHRFLDDVRRRFPTDPEMVSRVSLYEESGTQKIRMAHLAVVGSFSVNGVAELHTELLKTRVMPDFYRIWPEKFNNKTNGVTQRRWMLACNPALAKLVTRFIGPGWATELKQLERLAPLADDGDFLDALARVKHENKVHLAGYIEKHFGLQLDAGSIFDIQIKRIHEYKRQLLNALHIIHLYLQVKRNPQAIKSPRTFILGGKAAPGYAMAKLVIKLLNDIAARINSDPQVNAQLKVFFFPNYGVSSAEILFPAADVSQQISTAGFEASGTGNMKFALNGAVTLGTLDGANIEIAREVGADNIFIFGLTVDEVTQLRATGYDPRRYYQDNGYIAEVLDLLRGDFFNPQEPGLYQPIVDMLLHTDHYLHLADFEAYRLAQARIDEAYADRRHWAKMALMNIAKVGLFSSDRTIQEYVRDIWKLRAFHVEIQ